jgi:hypothetical protein
MAPTPPSFFRRIGLALSVLFNADLAAKLQRVQDEGEQPAVDTPTTPVPPVAEPQTVIVRETTPEAALQLLGLLQREARFVDFVQEDVAAYSDADIGAAARVVHEGCRKVLGEHFSIDPIRSEPEGSRITLPEGFDAAAVRLTGKVVGKPPFTGSLGHRGWRVTDTRLPKLAEGHYASVIAQAEVEL